MTHTTPPHRPVIGVTPDHDDALNKYVSYYNYSNAVEKAGGLPFILPYQSDLSLIPQYVDQLDGVLFTGGDDLNPAAWGETRHPHAGAVDPTREAFERALLSEVEKRRMPALGICLGCQLMNVHRGGSLHQFLPEMERTPALEHRVVNKNWSPRHDVTIDRGTILSATMGSTNVRTNSSHKQSVNQIGRGLNVIARAEDGVVEAIDDPTFPLFLGVQWHPERQHDEAEQLALFKLLVEKAREWATGKK